ncbi:MAG: nucleotidyl transferase AbiEii/AbiGii toxin family protein [Thermomicrobiales bacterium]
MSSERGRAVYLQLQRLAKARGIATDLLLNRYAVERFLYRLSRSQYRDRYVLKGASLFAAWVDQPYRATNDLDLAGFGASDDETIIATFRDIARGGDEGDDDDGLVFLVDNLTVSAIRHDEEYGGVCVRIPAHLHTARPVFQIDIAFGDVITPLADDITYPTLLPLPAPHLRAYPRETVVAEKWEAMVSLGAINSRMKDFFDVWVLARDFAFVGATLADAIAATFTRRGTALPTEPPVALTVFADDPTKQQQWRAFLQRGNVAGETATLAEVIAAITPFLMEPTRALTMGQPFARHWPSGGPWQETAEEHKA